MELWGTLLVAIGVVVAGAAAVFAWVQAHAAVETLKDARAARDEARVAAGESARLASEANAAFRRQAEAQEEANRLKVAEMTPPTWSGPTWVSGDLYRVVNSSMRAIKVRAFDIKPDGTEKRVGIRGPSNRHFESGDSFEYVVARAMGGNARKLTVVYNFDGDDEEHHFIIPL